MFKIKFVTDDGFTPVDLASPSIIRACLAEDIEIIYAEAEKRGLNGYVIVELAEDA